MGLARKSNLHGLDTSVSKDRNAELLSRLLTEQERCEIDVRSERLHARTHNRITHSNTGILSRAVRRHYGYQRAQLQCRTSFENQADPWMIYRSRSGSKPIDHTLEDGDIWGKRRGWLYWPEFRRKSLEHSRLDTYW